MGGPNPDRTARRPEWHHHRTLGDLKKDGFTLRAWCTKCGHERAVDLDHLIETRGLDACPWDRWVRCDSFGCRGRAVFSASANRYNYFRLSRDWT